MDLSSSSINQDISIKISVTDECIYALHYTLNSELGQITEELLENLKHYKGSSKLTSDNVAKQIGLIYRHLRCAIFNGFYETEGAYPIYVDESYDDDELTLPSSYHKKFVEPKQRHENVIRDFLETKTNFSKIKVDDSKFDSNGIGFYKRATKNLLDISDIFDNPTSGMKEKSITKSWMNRFLGTQYTHELDEAVNIYCQTDWMKSEKLEILLIKVFSAFNQAKMLRSTAYSDDLLKTIGKIIYEILFFIGNALLSEDLSDGQSEFIPLIFISIYFLKFYNPISVLLRQKSALDGNNNRFLDKVHNKIMSDDYFHPFLIKEEFHELERMGLNVSRYVFKILNISKN
jgi:hypothetical protein